MANANGTDGRRGRPRAFDREAALDAAILLFWERGYEATSVGDLTAAMGIGPGSLYAAFGGKKSLFMEAVRGYGRSQVGSVMARVLQEESTARGTFERLLREVAVVYCDPAHPAGCMTISAATNTTEQDADVADFLRDIRNANLLTFEARLREAITTGELPVTADPALLARYFAMIIQGMSQRSRDGATAAELTAMADLAMAAWPAAEPPDTASGGTAGAATAGTTADTAPGTSAGTSTDTAPGTSTDTTAGTAARTAARNTPA